MGWHSNTGCFKGNIHSVAVFDKNQNGEVEIVVTKNATVLQKIKHLLLTKQLNNLKYVDSTYTLTNGMWIEKETGMRTSLETQVRLINMYEDILKEISK